MKKRNRQQRETAALIRTVAQAMNDAYTPEQAREIADRLREAAVGHEPRERAALEELAHILDRQQLAHDLAAVYQVGREEAVQGLRDALRPPTPKPPEPSP